MYKTASDGRQRALHQGRPSDWVNGVELQTDVQQRDNMALAIQNLDERIRRETDPDVRKRLGQEKFSLQGKLSILGKKIKAENISRNGLHNYVAQAVNEMLPKAQRELIWARARRLQDDDRKRVERMLAETQEVIEPNNGQSTGTIK